MKVKILRISPEFFFSLFTEGLHPDRGYEVTKDALPADARLVNVRYWPPYGWPNWIELLVESESFPEVGEGQEAAFLNPIVETRATA